jgi:hypothetical protein
MRVLCIMPKPCVARVDETQMIFHGNSIWTSGRPYGIAVGGAKIVPRCRFWLVTPPMKRFDFMAKIN